MKNCFSYSYKNKNFIIKYNLIFNNNYFFQLVSFAALLVVARAGHLGYGAAPLVAPAIHGAAIGYAAHASPLAVAHHAAPVAYAAPIAKTIIAEPSAPAHYDFGYAVSDPLTGDHKSQQESRRGDVVQGKYFIFSKKLVSFLLYYFNYR